MNKTNNYLKFFLFFVALACVVYLGGRAYSAVTDGFMVRNILFEHEDDPRWAITPLTAEENTQINEILNQHFTYFAKGHQVFAFISDDGQYILKFLKTHVMRANPWLSYLPSQFDAFKQEKIDKRERRLAGVFTGWKTAYNDLRDETLVLYVHMNHSPKLNRTLQITDKIGRDYTIDLDQTAFLIQKKADVFSKVFENFIANGEQEKAKEYLQALLALYVSEYQRGFWEYDYHIIRNTGFVDGRAVHIDLGALSPLPPNPPPITTLLKDKTPRLLPWLKQRDPELAAYLQSEIAKLEAR